MLAIMRWLITPLILFVSLPAYADFQVGVAQIDITPDYPIRLHGFGGRRAESDGVAQRIKATALAIDDLVLIAVDNLGVPATMTAEIAKRLNVPPEKLAICATHTHTAPMLNGIAPAIFGQPIPQEHQQHIDQYTREFADRLAAVAKVALADRKPGKLSWGVGTVGFAINRRTKGGPVDHDLPILAVHGTDGKLRAVVVGYACHCVTMSNNKIGGDWAGQAREAIEAAHSGAVALVTIGCGADQNPNARAQGDNMEPAIAQGRAVAGEVDKLLKQFLAPVRGPITAKQKSVELEFAIPPRSQFEEAAKRNDAIGYHAKLNLARLDKGETLTGRLDYPITAWTFGNDLAMAFLPGEVVVDYGQRLKRELDGRRLWIAAYANDDPCYIPSERILKEGGYEGGGAMVYYDKPGPLKPGLEEKIVTTVKELVGGQFTARFDPNKVHPLPPSPQQARAAIRMADRFAVDLVAAEPLVQSPVAIAFGPDGQLWVAEMFDYPSGVRGDGQPGGRISVLSARDEQGRYHTSTVFLDNIPFPTGVTVWRNGVLVCAAPDILYAEDTDGDGKADVVKKLYSGFGTENFQARVNSLEYGLDGWVYGSCGLFGGTIRSFNGTELKLGNRDFRIKPDTGAIEPATGRTQHGRVRNDWGDWFGCDNSNLAWHYPLPDHYIRRNPHAAPAAILKQVSEEPDPNRVFPATKGLQMFQLSGPPGRATAACGIGVYRDDLLGKDLQGNLFTCEPVNLLVHRQVLTPSGSSFAGHRAPEEKDREFLASTDPWFRPVQVRTGPDGCLYVVDMARYVIEHPRWIPPGELAKVDVRAGSTLGRIYRVRNVNNPPRSLPRSIELSNADLAKQLDTPNGSVRDLATQMLAWRQQKSQLLDLGTRQILTNWTTMKQPAAILHALAALDTRNELNIEHIRAALADANPGVRRQAVRLSSRFLSDFVSDLLKLRDDADGQLKLQAILTLGDWNDPQAGNALAEVKCNDAFIKGAVLSGLNSRNLREYLKRAISPFDPSPADMIRGALSTAIGSGDHASTRLALERGLALPGVNAAAIQLRYDIPAAVLDLLSQNADANRAVLDVECKRLLTDGLRKARSEVSANTTALPMRLAALSALGWHSPDHSADIELLPKLLASNEPPEIQSAAVDALARIADPGVPKLLLAAWPDAAPALKTHIVDALLARTEGASAILETAETNPALIRSLDATRRQRLLKHRDPSIRALAARRLDSAGTTSRAAVLREFDAVAELPGDASHGKTVFVQRCATCHRLNDVGHAVGPDLGSLANKSPEYLLQEILDPNRNVDSRYVEYSAVTKSGRSVRGLIAAETATSVTLRGADAKDETLLRTDIDTLESTARSLMPEGFEKDLSRQDLADVMAYLGDGAAPLARRLLDNNLPADDRRGLLAQTKGKAAEIIAAMTSDMGVDAKGEYRRIPMIWQVAIAAGRRDDLTELRRLLDATLPKANEPLRDWQVVVLGGGIINGISQNGTWPGIRFGDLMHEQPALSARWADILNRAAAMADNPQVPDGTRYDALRMLALSDWNTTAPLFEKYLVQGANAELQMGAISGLADIDLPQATEKLIAVLAHANAENRKLAIDGLLRTAERKKALLAAIESKTVDPAWLNDIQKQKLK